MKRTDLLAILSRLEDIEAEVEAAELADVELLDTTQAVEEIRERVLSHMNEE